MALFDVGQLPPWMIQRETPADALARGIQAGSAIAHNILNARQVALQEQESIIRQQNSLKLREGLSAFGSYMGQIEDWSSVEAEKGAYALLNKYPWIANTPAFTQGMQNFEKARQAKEAIKSRETISAMSAQVRADTALLRSMNLESAQQARLNEISLKAELGVTPTFEDRVFIEGIKAANASNLTAQRGEQTMTQIERRGEQSLEQIEARHQARLQEIDAKIKGTLENAPKMIRNTARVAALQSELRALEDDIKLKYDPVKKAAALEAILKKYDVDIKSETIKTVPGTGLTPIGPPIPELDDIELRYARDAIAAGVPKDRVSARYKQRTGKDFPE